MAPVRKEYSTVCGKSKERIRDGANPLEYENAYKNVSFSVTTMQQSSVVRCWFSMGPRR